MEYHVFFSSLPCVSMRRLGLVSRVWIPFYEGSDFESQRLASEPLCPSDMKRWPPLRINSKGRRSNLCQISGVPRKWMTAYDISSEDTLVDIQQKYVLSVSGIPFYCSFSLVVDHSLVIYLFPTQLPIFFASYPSHLESPKVCILSIPVHVRLLWDKSLVYPFSTLRFSFLRILPSLELHYPKLIPSLCSD